MFVTRKEIAAKKVTTTSTGKIPVNVGYARTAGVSRELTEEDFQQMERNGIARPIRMRLPV